MYLQLLEINFKVPRKQYITIFHSDTIGSVSWPMKVRRSSGFSVEWNPKPPNEEAVLYSQSYHTPTKTRNEHKIEDFEISKINRLANLLPNLKCDRRMSGINILIGCWQICRNLNHVWANLRKLRKPGGFASLKPV